MIFPDEIPKDLKTSFIKKMNNIKYAKKICNQTYNLSCSSSSTTITGIKYYFAFVSKRNNDNTIDLGYYYLYEKKDIEKAHQVKKKGDKVLGKYYSDNLEDINKYFGGVASEKKIEEIRNMLNESKKELGS